MIDQFDWRPEARSPCRPPQLPGGQIMTGVCRETLEHESNRLTPAATNPSRTLPFQSTPSVRSSCLGRMRVASLVALHSPQSGSPGPLMFTSRVKETSMFQKFPISSRASPIFMVYVKYVEAQ